MICLPDWLLCLASCRTASCRFFNGLKDNKHCNQEIRAEVKRLQCNKNTCKTWPWLHEQKGNYTLWENEGICTTFSANISIKQTINLASRSTLAEPMQCQQMPSIWILIGDHLDRSLHLPCACGHWLDCAHRRWLDHEYSIQQASDTWVSGPYGDWNNQAIPDGDGLSLGLGLCDSVQSVIATLIEMRGYINLDSAEKSCTELI